MCVFRHRPSSVRLAVVVSTACLALCLTFASRRYSPAHEARALSAFFALSSFPRCPPLLSFPGALSNGTCFTERKAPVEQYRPLLVCCPRLSLSCPPCCFPLRSITRWHGDVELRSRAQVRPALTRGLLASLPCSPPVHGSCFRGRGVNPLLTGRSAQKDASRDQLGAVVRCQHYGSSQGRFALPFCRLLPGLLYGSWLEP